MKSLPPSSRKTAFLFPGSGSQYLGMGKDLYGEFASIRREMDALSAKSPFDLKKIMFDGPRELLFPPLDAPAPSIFIEVVLYLSMAVARALRSEGITPDFVAGRSMGEFSACALAGVFDEKACLSMAREMLVKGQPHNLKRPTKLVTVYGLSRERMQATAAALKKEGSFCELVTFYAKPRIGFFGIAPEAVPRLRAALSGTRHRISVSREPNAFHTSAYDAYAKELRHSFSKLPFKDAACPVFTNCDARPHVSGSKLREALINGFHHGVKWCESIEEMAGRGARMFVEIAPGAMLTEFICELPPDAEVLRTDSPENFRLTLKRLSEK